MKLLMSSILLSLLLSISLAAQAFPVTITAAWDPNPPEDAVTKYTITFNNVTTDIPLANCTAVECTTTLTVPSAGSYTISLTASNFWGRSIPTTLSFTASSPGRSGNLRIRVN